MPGGAEGPGRGIATGIPEAVGLVYSIWLTCRLPSEFRGILAARQWAVDQ
jgi:hypothetical protein